MEKAFDKDELSSRLGDDDALLREIVNVYLLDLPKQIEDLRVAYQNVDMEALSRTSHSIKGSSANVSAKKVQSTAVEIERAVNSQHLEEIPSLLMKLEGQFDELMTHLSDWL